VTESWFTPRPERINVRDSYGLRHYTIAEADDLHKELGYALREADMDLSQRGGASGFPSPLPAAPLVESDVVGMSMLHWALEKLGLK
jgi:hypothetical protein